VLRGAAFTIMVVGESGLGKTTFVNTLFSTTIKNYAEHRLRHKKQMDKTVCATAFDVGLSDTNTTRRSRLLLLKLSSRRSSSKVCLVSAWFDAGY